MKRVLIVGDLHLPFEIDGYLDFLIETYQIFDCDTVVFIGDIFDNLVFSSHGVPAMAHGAQMEYELAFKKLQEYIEAFPNAKVCIGNHETRLYRKLDEINVIPDIWMKSYKSVYNMPDSWEISDEFIIDNVKYQHGTGYSGKTPSLNAALNNRMSTVMGHTHSVGSVTYQNNGSDTIFGLSVGCGVDDESVAMAYGKHNKNKSVLGCGIVFSDKEAYFRPMEV